MGATLSADMSVLFDVGGIAGAIIAGVISDKYEMPATTCVCMLLLSAPMVFFLFYFRFLTYHSLIILLL